jgi:hypothetical protein
MPRAPADKTEAARLTLAKNLMRQYRACILLRTDEDMPSPDSATRVAFTGLGLPTSPQANKTMAETFRDWLNERIRELLVRYDPRLRPDNIACRNLLCFHYYNIERFLSNAQLTQQLADVVSLHQTWEAVTGQAITKLSPLPAHQRKAHGQLDGILPMTARTASNAIHAGLMLVFGINNGSRRVSAERGKTKTKQNPTPLDTIPQRDKTLDDAAITTVVKQRIHDTPTRIRFNAFIQNGFAWLAKTPLGLNALIKAAKLNADEWALLRDYAVQATQQLRLAVNADALLRAFGQLALKMKLTGQSLDSPISPDESDTQNLPHFIACHLLRKHGDVLHICSPHTAQLCLTPAWVEHAAALITHQKDTLSAPARSLLHKLTDEEFMLRHLLTQVQYAVANQSASPWLAAQVITSLPIDALTRHFAAIQRMATELGKMWTEHPRDSAEQAALRKINLWLIRYEPAQDHLQDAPQDFERLHDCLCLTTESLDREALALACKIVCKHFNSPAQPEFTAPLYELFAKEQHWQAEILVGVIRVNKPSAFELLLALLRHPAATKELKQHETARYVRYRCAEAVDSSVVFDLARDHLQTLSNQPHRDMSELAFFIELVKGTDFDSIHCQMFTQSTT